MAKSRNEIRSAIFSGVNAKPKSKTIKFFGEDVEVRQPDMKTILDYRDANQEDRRKAMVNMIITYVYVPGSQEKVFDTADEEGLLAMPFGADYTRLQKTISELTDVNLAVEETTKNSDGTA